MTETRRRLFGYRDYRLLWVGQTLSLVGSQSSWIAYPLLVLALTGSAARAGLISFASWLPYVLFQLPAGALVDRWHRKWTMVCCDALRAAAVGSIVAALAFDVLAFWQLAVVAFIERTLSLLFAPAETAALSRVVPAERMREAVARNDARENMAGVIGPPLGGALFGIAQLAPFALDAASYLVSLVSVAALRTPLASAPASARASLRREIGEGISFIWRIPFLRASALQAMGTNVTWSSVVLAILVIARHHGASGGEVGAMLAIFSLGGVAGSTASGPLLRRFSPPLLVVGSVWCWAALVALLVLTTNPFLLGAIGGAALFLAPAWNGTVAGLRIRMTPDQLQGRVDSVDSLLSFGARPFGMLVTGYLLDAIGGRATLGIIAGWTLTIALLSAVSPSLRQTPTLTAQETAAVVKPANSGIADTRGND